MLMDAWSGSQGNTGQPHTEARGAAAQGHHAMGAHLRLDHGVAGARFRVWAPNAKAVSVIGDFNGWQGGLHKLHPLSDDSGVWGGFVPGAQHGQRYKYRIEPEQGEPVDKADPYAFLAEEPPRTGSVLWDLSYEWRDGDWMAHRMARNALGAPMSIYELHAGSWRSGRDGRRFLGYEELADELIPYLLEMGFTHVEVMPLTEHPFYGSWGYQTTGYFAATSRYGTPQQLMRFVDRLHQAGIGVILDWVPSHFPNDAHGLATFDGTHLYEHADPRQGFHPEWNSLIFNYGRHEVADFLIDSALFWLDTYHFDGLRVDGVASMLYLDYARKAGEWIPNKHGGHENLEAVAFLRRLNTEVYARHPDVQMIAEESTAWPGVSRPVGSADGLAGLGFGLKWNLGWMHDTLRHFARDPLYRGFHLADLSFGLVYAFSENFVLSLSHDEVVHGKGSLLGRQFGDRWQRFANLRTLYGLMWGHPGKKLLFMGGELGVEREWHHEATLDWSLLKDPLNAGLRRWVADLNRVYRSHPALFEIDFSEAGFRWLVRDDAQHGVVAFLRQGHDEAHPVLVVLNLTPEVRHGYRLGVPLPGHWRELLNSDASHYGGSGVGNLGGVDAVQAPHQHQPCSLTLTLPPLAALFFEAPR